jgi:hypothetical protein
MNQNGTKATNIFFKNLRKCVNSMDAHQIHTKNAPHHLCQECLQTTEAFEGQFCSLQGLQAISLSRFSYTNEV